MEFGFKFKIITPKIVNGMFSIKRTTVDFFVAEGSDILIYNKENGEEMHLIPFDYEAEDGLSLKFKFVKNTQDNLNDWEKIVLKRFHWSWFNELRYDLNSKWFKDLNLELNINERDKKEIYPSIENVYNAFSTPLNIIKVVIVGQSPYPQKGIANGWAFAFDGDAKPISFKMIEDKTGPLPNKLSTWINQGVLLLNSSLTIGADKQEYTVDWEKFIRLIIFTVAKQNPVWLLMGKVAQRYTGKIPLDQSIIITEHPVAASYAKRDWYHNDCFNRCNEYLVKQGKDSIIWSK